MAVGLCITWALTWYKDVIFPAYGIGYEHKISQLCSCRIYIWFIILRLINAVKFGIKHKFHMPHFHMNSLRMWCVWCHYMPAVKPLNGFPQVEWSVTHYRWSHGMESNSCKWPVCNYWSCQQWYHLIFKFIIQNSSLNTHCEIAL